MLKRQNIKYKIAGSGSCLLLLLLTFPVLSPITPAHAKDNTNVEDYEIATLADTPSTVAISFSPSAGSTSLSPATSAGQSAQIKVLATVNVQKSGGYSVYIKSNSQNLVGTKSSSNTIPGMQGSTTYANMPVNTWGYYATEGTTIPDNATYKAISTTGNGDKITENTSNKITSDTKTIALSFAAKVNDAKPADTYKNTVTMSVVSSPMQVSFADQGVATMQQMTSTICDAVSVGQEAQLKDTRDGKFYWVSKLADGKCWMTQNLGLNLSTDTKLTTADSDVPAAGYTPAHNTATTATSATIYDSSTGQYSWNLGSYYIKTPNGTTSCGSKKNSLADCTTYFTALTTPTSANGDTNAHYLAGNYYQWNAATAGTGASITSGQASSSICPKNWKLPTSAEYTALIAALGGTASTDNVTQAPFYGVRGGYVWQHVNSLFDGAGYEGNYWSSTPHSDTAYTYYLLFQGTADLRPAYNLGSRKAGYSVRCMAR